MQQAIVMWGKRQTFCVSYTSAIVRSIHVQFTFYNSTIFVISALLALRRRARCILPWYHICHRPSSILLSFMLDTSNWPVLSTAPLCTLPKHDKCVCVCVGGGGILGTVCTRGECTGGHCAHGDILPKGRMSWCELGGGDHLHYYTGIRQYFSPNRTLGSECLQPTKQTEASSMCWRSKPGNRVLRSGNDTPASQTPTEPRSANTLPLLLLCACL